MTKQKDLTNNKIKKRDIEELNSSSYLISQHGATIALDYWETPYTIIYFIFKEGWNINHFNIFKIILKKLNKEKFDIVGNNDIVDIIRTELDYLLSAKLVIKCGIDYDNDLDFTELYNYSFIDYVKDKGDYIHIKVNKEFYNMMDKYFKLS